MRLTTNKTKNGISYYIIRSVRRDGKRSSEVVERLGTEREIMEKYHCTDANKWAKAHLDELNQAEAEKQHKVLVPLRTDILIPFDKQNSYNVGYLFLQKIYYDLRLPNICRKISKEYSFSYDLDSILSRLVYERILNPSSKLSCYEQSSDLLEPPAFELHQIYRALSVIANESDSIQAELYEASRRLVKRQTGVLYYDCTNYFFETECQEGLKQYGPSKEHRPSPIVEMGLFIDRSGIPLAFCIHPCLYHQTEYHHLLAAARTIPQKYQSNGKFPHCQPQQDVYKRQAVISIYIWIVVWIILCIVTMI